MPLFKGPVGRSFAAWREESELHGWPSFREQETFMENIVFKDDGEMLTKQCGTHLGHNLPDSKGDRYCINLVCMAGDPDQVETAAPVDVPEDKAGVYEKDKAKVSAAPSHGLAAVLLLAVLAVVYADVRRGRLSTAAVLDRRRRTKRA